MIAVSPEVLRIDALPLYWRIRKPGEPAHESIPSSLPIELRVDAGLGLLVQRVDAGLRATLHDVYLAESNIGYLQEGHTLARGYGEDLLRFLRRCIASQDIQRAMEIGCGGCMMLAALSGDGIDVVGVDPSPVAVRAGRKLKVPVVESFFPPTQTLAAADLIFHADVLEHVEDPVAFLRSHHEFLSPRGHVAVAVPDSTESVALGDISMLMHQHINYFTLGSLPRVMQAAGFEVISVEKSGYGGSLYALARRNPGSRTQLDVGAADESRFFERAKVSLERVRARVPRARDLGFYMPLRSAPYLAGLDLVAPGIRVFDDTSHWHRGQIDGLPLAIENIADFQANPPSDAFVMSLTFGDVVREKIRNVAPRVRVSTLRELLAA